MTVEMGTCAFITLGCKVNQYDTEAIREQVLRLGYREVPAGERADLYVINTCTVTAVSDSKGRKLIRRVHRQNPAATIIVTGCTVDSDPHLSAKLSDCGEVIVVPNHAKSSIAAIVGDRQRFTVQERPSKNGACPRLWDRGISRFEGHTRAFIKIEDGCTNFCAYCIVPYVRGPVRSRPLDSIVSEARRLADAGFREIVLTGIHVGAYGQDGSGHNLADVVVAVNAIGGIHQLRLSSIEAMEVTDRLIDLAASGKLCPHFHLPLQSGSDRVLSAMNRRYTAAQFMQAVERIAKRIPRPSFTTDVLVGFPGETDDDFRATERVCREVGFSRTHVFPYSERPGTAAALLPEKCPAGVIAERKRRMLTVGRETALAYKQQFVGCEADVLVESERDPSGKLCGYTDRYIRVVFDGPDTLKGTLARVLLEQGSPEKMKGRIMG
ncbi:MAG TPA: tRNA (N(6)-L-threonylcarbamoyladenosine(37)-C(2))-methylthiotransferase MtaB [Planctomycetota bacterium]|nr:tRNA (N(6)-L-threonylcarbamoyladenosine(37)-C(2))-methylthiotransferase MtaB [Planctomycetota bacterium]